jgi:hypothetical protein
MAQDADLSEIGRLAAGCEVIPVGEAELSVSLGSLSSNQFSIVTVISLVVPACSK